MVLVTEKIRKNGEDPIFLLVQELKKLPGIGGKTATRLAYALIKKNKSEIDALINAIINMKEDVTLCSVCYNLSNMNPCAFCSDSNRNNDTICVVEEPSHIKVIEQGGNFKGRYHVLHGTISPLDGVGPKDLKVQDLAARVEKNGIREVIVATNPTASGDVTAVYISRLLKPHGIKITRIGLGVPVGGDLDYIDPMTLNRAIENRKEV
ncbi:MAG TPA: recombination mediator RecR [bacterium]